MAMAKMISLLCRFRRLQLEVFNRWGKSVFKSTDYKNDWGKGIANGTYFYVVDTPQGNHCKGWVEVLE